MKKKSMFGYYSAGFSLTNHSTVLIVLFYLLDKVNYGLNLILQQIPNNSANLVIVKLIIQISSTGVLLLYLGFTVSLPVFFQKIQSKEPISSSFFISTVVSSAKRLIVPVLVFIVLFTVFIVGGLILTNPNPKQITSFFQIFNTKNPLFIVFAFIMSFFQFTSLYFSLNKDNLFVAMKKSVFTSIKHISFIFSIMLLSLCYFAVFIIVPTNIYLQFYILFSIVGSYFTFLNSAITFQYYKEKVLIKSHTNIEK